MSLSGWDWASWDRRGSAGLSEGGSCGSSGSGTITEGGWEGSGASGPGAVGADCWVCCGVEALSSSESESSSQPMFSSGVSVAPGVGW